MKRRIGAIGVSVIVFAVVLGTITVMRLTSLGAAFYNPVGDVMNGALSPAEGFFLRVSGGVGDVANSLFGFGVQEENETLRQAVEDLVAENALLREQLAGSERVRVSNDSEFLELYRDKLVVADVIGRNQNAWYQTVKINKGRRHGIILNAPVLTHAGLVGKVVSLTETTAQVLLLTDAQGQASAFVRDVRGEAVFGVIYGAYRQGSRLQERETLRMDFRQEDEVVVGDLVLTSGLGGVYPKGVVIGTVADVVMNPSGLMKTAYVTPAVGFDAIEAVSVLCGGVSEE
ncbi:MAG: rod shape-determining protein MreC [Gracilibacteraceae bacterium]|jgi:rod shape-determining protein MreC|nr:rod shape-determining protein MreC [Gracilibacteraceae bacterium]